MPDAKAGHVSGMLAYHPPSTRPVMANTLTIELPFGVEPDEAALLLSVQLFEEGKVSLGTAARMAGYSKLTYMELLGRRGVPVFNYDPDELDWDLETLRAFDAGQGQGSGTGQP